MFKCIVNKDTELRLLEVRHAEELFQLTDASRSSLRKWLPWIDSTKTVANTKEFIEESLKQFCNNDGFQAGIWYKGELAGVVGLHTINWPNKSTSLGYWLGDSFQGKGLITKSCQEVIKYCFNELELKRIEIRAAVGNEKSVAIPHRLGFKKEGCLAKSELLNGEYVDHYVFGLINET
ncbi:GNAT family N-acetyltransferase [Salimicrobium salexigens]|uniref:Ribosomal-protein-serine acetyltransferase n=1 Tax=Salimicrobium salexigens TaxID=908941 RepID=A0ABY1KQT1_9BACI|nr:GNAT family protein [Salimicrobium salexigens]SIS66418.1 ribosomal-protein-serine acetyltransferase [Salimicrobium salexigens]